MSTNSSMSCSRGFATHLAPHGDAMWSPRACRGVLPVAACCRRQQQSSTQACQAHAHKVDSRSGGPVLLHALLEAMLCVITPKKQQLPLHLSMTEPGTTFTFPHTRIYDTRLCADALDLPTSTASPGCIQTLCSTCVTAAKRSQHAVCTNMHKHHLSPRCPSTLPQTLSLTCATYPRHASTARRPFL
jgi:hypothetical protein